MYAIVPFMKVSEIEEKLNLEPGLAEMATAGLHFGHKTSKTHPKMAEYIAGVRNTIHIIDLEKTKEKLALALDFISQLAASGKVILIVGTKPHIKNLVEETAHDCNLPYVVTRWIGGTLTNFSVISKRIEYFKELEVKKEQGEFEKYTKKEQAQIEKELHSLKERFGGIKELKSLPDALFVCDVDENAIAIREAKKAGIKVIAIVDTNNDPTQADYAIPANNDALSSVKYILEKVKEAILNAQSSNPAVKTAS